MQIVSRAAWGARPPTSRVTGDIITETFLHHSVGYGLGGADYMRQMQDQHMDANGWTDIAYNHVIDPKTLTVFEGRGWGVRPGAQKSYNTGTWAVCVMGHFGNWTPAMFPGLLELVAELIAYGHQLGHLPLELTGGHRDAPNQSTTCPGVHLYAAVPTIRTLLEETMPLTAADVQAIWSYPVPQAGVGVTTQLALARAANLSAATFNVVSNFDTVTDAELDAAVDELVALLPPAVLAALKAKL